MATDLDAPEHSLCSQALATAKAEIADLNRQLKSVRTQLEHYRKRKEELLQPLLLERLHELAGTGASATRYEARSMASEILTLRSLVVDQTEQTTNDDINDDIVDHSAPVTPINDKEEPEWRTTVRGALTVVDDHAAALEEQKKIIKRAKKDIKLGVLPLGEALCDECDSIAYTRWYTNHRTKHERVAMTLCKRHNDEHMKQSAENRKRLGLDGGKNGGA